MTNDLHIAYLEPDDSSRDALISGLEDFFKCSGLKPIIREVKGADEVIADAKNGRLDVFVCDLSLDTGNKPLGLSVISDIKSAYPSLFIICVSRGDARLKEVEARQHTFDMFIPKVAITGRGFEGTPNYVVRFRDKFRYSPVRSITVETDSEPIEGFREPSREELLALIRQVISYRSPVDVSALARDVTVKQLTGGRSRSYVYVLNFKVSMLNRTVLPMVLKVSEPSSALEELRTYQSYVRWTLPHQVRVDILGHAQTNEFAAVAYSFAHGGQKISTLRDVLKSGDPKDVRVVLERLFEVLEAYWIEMPAPTPNASIHERYFSRFYQGQAGWFEEDERKIDDFISEIKLPISKQGISVSIYGKKYPELTSFLSTGGKFLTDRKNHKWSIVHGDLNPGNVLVSESRDIALIDFCDSGIGHRYEDLITLEAGIRINWPWKSKDESVLTYSKNRLKSESEINSDRTAIPDGDPGWELIQTVRTSAERTFSNPLDSEYFYALAYYCFRLMRIDTFTKHQKAALLSAAYAAASATETNGIK